MRDTIRYKVTPQSIKLKDNRVCLDNYLNFLHFFFNCELHSLIKLLRKKLNRSML